MKKITKAELRNFAESLASSLEEVADKIGTIEAIINGNDGAETETVEDEDYVEEPTEESETDTEPAEETADENFSDATAHYENVKNFLTL